jgi:phosphate transport system substrate-binding protein
MLRVARKTGEPAVEPTVANTLDRSYPLARSLQVYTLGEPEGEVRRYIEWMLSPDGQRLVEENGYVPVASAPHGS